MPRGGAMFQSVVFHGIVVGAFVVGVPHLSRDFVPPPPILTVEIVETLPETNLDEGVDVKPVKQEAPAPEEQTEQTPPPPPPPPPEAPPAPETPPPAPQTAEAVPVPSPEPKPEAAPKTEKPKSKPKPVKAPPKKPLLKSPANTQNKNNQLALASKLQDLTERQATLRQKQEEEEKKKKKARNKLDELLANAQKNKDTENEQDEARARLDQLAGQALNTPTRTSDRTGVSLGDLLANHIGQRWNPPSGAAGADALIVDIIVRLDKNAEVLEVEIVDKARFKNDPTYKAAANAARRAVFDSSPLPLSLDEYERWKELPIEFNPRFITRR